MQNDVNEHHQDGTNDKRQKQVDVHVVSGTSQLSSKEIQSHAEDLKAVHLGKETPGLTALAG